MSDIFITSGNPTNSFLTKDGRNCEI